MQQRYLNLINVYGFGILKNGVKFDFPFRESVLSLKPICQKIFYVLGDSVDSTDEEFKKFPFIEIEKSTWDMSLKDGHVVGVETNKALSFLRRSVDVKNSWGIYLQADEVLHEDDYELLLKDIKFAEENGYDSLSFRYLHFWQSHHKLAISKTWYPHEIRAIKLDSEIVSWGDGQSFDHCKKTFFTEARIFHYGHIREASAYSSKMQFQASFHFKGLRYYRKRFGAFINHHKQKTITYLGSHPAVMKERIIRLHDKWNLPETGSLCLIAEKKKYSQNLVETINAVNVVWVNSKKEIPKNFSGQIINLKNSGFPEKMYSSLAKNWSDDFRLILQLSEKGISFKSSSDRQ